MAYYEGIEVVPSSDDPEGFNYIRGNSNEPLEAECYQLQADIDDALQTLDVVLPRSERAVSEQRIAIFNKLYSAAYNGLAGEIPQLVLGQQELKGAKNLLVEAARTTRSKYIRQTYLLAFFVVVGGFGGAFILLKHSSTVEPILGMIVINLVRSALFSLPGIGIANVLYAMVRHRHIEFSNLRAMDEYKFKPIERYVYIFVVTIVVGILLFFDVVIIGVGSIVLNTFENRAELGLLIGLVCGMAEPIIVNIIRGAITPTVRTAG